MRYTMFALYLLLMGLCSVMTFFATDNYLRSQRIAEVRWANDRIIVEMRGPHCGEGYFGPWRPREMESGVGMGCGNLYMHFRMDPR